MIGLTSAELQTLRNVFSRFSDISEVILFGSRACGTHRPSSDVDLALKGKNLGLDTLAKLRYILEEETNLPYFFDIVIYDRVENEALKREIDENGQSLFMLVKHRFLDKYPISGKKILIIGTFNPDIICNPANYFYSRNKNYFWELLPSIFENSSLKNSSVEEKILFLNNHAIELTDLIYSVLLDTDSIGDYGDEKLNNVVCWNTQKIIEVLKIGITKEVYFTRKTFNGIKNIEAEIKKIEKVCEEKRIKFSLLPTPARFAGDSKMQEWKRAFD